MEEQVQESMEKVSPQPMNVLVFGKHDYIVNNTQTILSKGGYEVVCFVDRENARMYLTANPCDMIFFVGGVDPHDRLFLKGVIDESAPHVKLLDHFGGPATILQEVNTAFGK